MIEGTPLTRAERKKQELRDDIVDAAFAEFAERGYHQTGIADIARRAGIGHGTAYLHFENKRDIVEHVVDRQVKRIMEAIAAENAPDAATSLDEYRGQLARIADAFGEILVEDPRAARLLLLEATSVDPDMTQRMLDLLDLASELVAAYFENGIKRGYLRPDLDVRPTADATVGMILGSSLRFLRNPGGLEERRQSGAAVAHLLIGGIAANPKEDS